MSLWFSNYKDTKLPEREQQHATKHRIGMHSSMKNYSSNFILQRKKKPLQRDVMLVFKFLNDFSNVDHSKVLGVIQLRKLEKSYLPIQWRPCNTDIGKVFPQAKWFDTGTTSWRSSWCENNQMWTFALAHIALLYTGGTWTFPDARTVNGFT